MVNYADAKIYRIVDNSTGLQYIGSTTQPLAKRLFEHRKNYRTWVNKDRPTGTSSYYMTSFEILEGGNETIEIIEKCDVSSRDELRAREGYWIRELDCVNKVVVGRTGKEYYEVNKEGICARNKEYHQANKEVINARHKEYYEANGGDICARLRALPKVVCEHCGCEVKQQQMKRHQRTAKKCLAAQAAKADPLIEQKREWKREPVRCEVCGATTTKGNYAQHKKAKYCLEAAAAKAEQGL